MYHTFTDRNRSGSSLASQFIEGVDFGPMQPSLVIIGASHGCGKHTVAKPYSSDGNRTAKMWIFPFHPITSFLKMSDYIVFESYFTVNMQPVSLCTPPLFIEAPVTFFQAFNCSISWPNSTSACRLWAYSLIYSMAEKYPSLS